ncbi:MAG: hypothetical protein C4541_01040 [Candidatus Auribacter fodinae]|jgi:putative protease|uniref:U32 family peptidase n=1 Tax=Candidatus Auribacter fodinae TaxID=2093366 RepID=A0A3A4R610_9BACT|nr:MAG: hypothetical protein C4541_01040 [Candidatus Auribacter fodinae]
MTNNLKRPELLAPAGKTDVLTGVINAGADAVYVSGKKFNMRRHRKDFHFSDDDLRNCSEFIHERGKKLYVVVNSLIGDNEIPELADFLHYLKSIHIDAIIVQDMAVAVLCTEEGIDIPLHASTMMNINNTQSALMLKSAGFTRAVTSRDISIDQVRRIREESGIEMEYFIHGDMCSVQSGQCLSSGLLFGKSANRGQCLKMCRWSFDLVSEKTGDIIKKDAYLLAAKDMCIIQHIPDFIEAGIDSFKIEGRMKPIDVLVPIVTAYRRQIDAYLSNPLEYTRNYDVSRSIHDNRMRNMSTGFSFGAPDSSFIDISGEREPLFLSYSGSLSPINDFSFDPFQYEADASNKKLPGLTCIAGSFESARQAILNGANTIVLSWEGDVQIDSHWTEQELHDIHTLCKAHNKQLVMRTPRITTSRELNELQFIVDRFDWIDTYAITSIASIPLLRSCNKTIWTDASCNVINGKSAKYYMEQGVSRIMPSLEASFDTIRNLIADNPHIPFDLLIHGTLTGMVLEHCLIAMNLSQSSKQEFCKMPCKYDHYSMRDRAGNLRSIRTDRYCRNHIIMEKELTVLPALKSFLSLGAHSLRIDATDFPPEKTARIIRLFKEAIHNKGINLEENIKTLTDCRDASSFTYGAYIRGIMDDNSRSLYSLKKEEAHV